jgi:hypothetical protein
MEQANGYEKKLNSLGQTLESFEKAMTIDASEFGAIEPDSR